MYYELKPIYDLSSIYKKHKNKINRCKSAIYRLLTNYNYTLKVEDNEVEINLKDIRYYVSDNYKKELEDELNKHLKELIYEFDLKYSMKIDNIIIKFDEKSYSYEGKKFR